MSESCSTPEPVKMTLRHEVYQSFLREPRSLRDLVRTIALFVPDDHQIADDIESCLESMSFGPPQMWPEYLGRLLDDIFDHFGDDEKTWPMWFKAICIINAGGHENSDAMLKEFDYVKTT